MGTKFGPIVQCETDEMNTLLKFSCEIPAFTLFILIMSFQQSIEWQI